jgi:hypothetical protein
MQSGVMTQLAPVSRWLSQLAGRIPAVGWKFSRSVLEDAPQQVGKALRSRLEKAPQSAGNFPAVRWKIIPSNISVVNKLRFPKVLKLFYSSAFLFKEPYNHQTSSFTEMKWHDGR